MSLDAAGSFPGRVSFHEVVIPAGVAVSNGMGVGAGVICGVLFPSAISGTNYNIQTSLDEGATFFDVCSEIACPIIITPTVSKYHRVVPQDYAGVNYLRIQSDTNEVAEITLTIAIRAID